MTAHRAPRITSHLLYKAAPVMVREMIMIPTMKKAQNAPRAPPRPTTVKIARSAKMRLKMLKIRTALLESQQQPTNVEINMRSILSSNC